MKKNNKSKKNLLLVFAILFATALTGTIVSNTYAKYTASLGEKESTATVAKWAFETDNSETALSFTLDQTKVKANTLSEEKIAPGTEGSFTVSLSNANSEVAVDYTITFDASSLPANVVLYSDEECITEITDNKLTGTLAPKAAATDVKAYWKWAYETKAEDETVTVGDTADNTAATNPTSLAIKATITGVQASPVKSN